MLKQQANRIYHRVELRDPTYEDNPPTVPYMWLNGLTGELFSCLSNIVDHNTWIGALGTVSTYLSPEYYPTTISSLGVSEPTAHCSEATVIEGNLIVSCPYNGRCYFYNGLDSYSHYVTMVEDPYGIAWDGSDMFVAGYDSNTIIKYSGTTNTALIHKTGVTSVSSAYGPKDVAYHDGKVYVIFYSSYVVRVYDSSTLNWIEDITLSNVNHYISGIEIISGNIVILQSYDDGNYGFHIYAGLSGTKKDFIPLPVKNGLQSLTRFDDMLVSFNRDNNMVTYHELEINQWVEV